MGGTEKSIMNLPDLDRMIAEVTPAELEAAVDREHPPSRIRLAVGLARLHGEDSITLRWWRLAELFRAEIWGDRR